ncbi:DUF6477 family protein [Aliiroseovarius lamellibrachiae]|uniref:DUF6477 family protein n=1 Tax=Aliiroseovarius lamellibrachiae TaxID=1924933 RepID=UPI001BE11FD0|nr:DUF6477 family protein [Aliiroseovarius lamellibrachiae]MBT2132067.1 hypothetical protein [Aliiroseovarius lamellibrachiae]
MTDALDLLKTLRRPRLLIRAARFGIVDYNRDRDLKRLMKSASTPTPTRAVDGLMEEEARLEQIRKTGDGAYSVSRHVEVLIALMAEARLLPRKLRSV